MATAAKEQHAWEEPCGQGCLYEAAELFTAQVAEMETELEQSKLEKQLRQSYIKAAKNITFRNKTLEHLINEYADNVAHSVFGGLGTREWLKNDQDKHTMVLLLDAGIKDIFPGGLFKDVEQNYFEGLVMAAYQRSFDQQRFWPVLSEVVADQVQGPKTKKKVYNAIEAGRKFAIAAGEASAEDFVTLWCTKTVEQLASVCNHGPQELIEPERLSSVFLAMLSAEVLPPCANVSSGQRPSNHTVEDAISNAFTPFASLTDGPAGAGNAIADGAPDAVSVEEPSEKRRKIMEALAKL